MHTVTVPFGDAIFVEDVGIFVAARREEFGEVWLSVGTTGLKNATATLYVNDVLLYETPKSVFELRLMSWSNLNAKIAIIPVQANLRVFYSFSEEYAGDNSFTDEEREKIGASLSSVREQIESLSNINKEQFEYLSHKLEEILAGSQRFGRKDWINWSMGYLMNISSAISLDRKTTSAVGTAFSEALEWLRVSGANLIDS